MRVIKFDLGVPAYGGMTKSEMKVQIGDTVLHTQMMHPPGYPTADSAYFEHTIKKQMTDMISSEIMRQLLQGT